MIKFETSHVILMDSLGLEPLNKGFSSFDVHGNYYMFQTSLEEIVMLQVWSRAHEVASLKFPGNPDLVPHGLRISITKLAKTDTAHLDCIHSPSCLNINSLGSQ